MTIVEYDYEWNPNIETEGYLNAVVTPAVCCDADPDERRSDHENHHNQLYFGINLFNGSAEADVNMSFDTPFYLSVGTCSALELGLTITATAEGNLLDVWSAGESYELLKEDWEIWAVSLPVIVLVSLR